MANVEAVIKTDEGTRVGVLDNADGKSVFVWVARDDDKEDDERVAELSIGECIALIEKLSAALAKFV